MRALTVRIHGTGRGELLSARRIAKAAGLVEHRLVSVPELREAADISKGPLAGGRVPPTYIPMKNSVFYALAGAYADEVGAEAIIGGHNRDDAEVFVDAGDRFFAALERALRGGSPRLSRLRVERPLRRLSKAEVVQLAARIGVPLELTWSCHGTGTAPCWRCAGCLGRRAAFRSAGVADPLEPNKG